MTPEEMYLTDRLDVQIAHFYEKRAKFQIGRAKSLI